MTAPGQKATSVGVATMSALPSNADIWDVKSDVWEGPDSDFGDEVAHRSFRQSRDAEAFRILFYKFRLLVGAEVGHQTRDTKLRIDGVQS
jgi:hypothetical protein